MKFGKRYCPSHYIKMQDMDAIVLEVIRSLAQLVVEDEEKAKAEFLARKAKHNEAVLRGHQEVRRRQMPLAGAYP